MPFEEARSFKARGNILPRALFTELADESLAYPPQIRPSAVRATLVDVVTDANLRARRILFVVVRALFSVGAM